MKNRTLKLPHLTIGARFKLIAHKYGFLEQSTQVDFFVEGPLCDAEGKVDWEATAKELVYLYLVLDEDVADIERKHTAALATVRGQYDSLRQSHDHLRQDVGLFVSWVTSSWWGFFVPKNFVERLLEMC